ncbi:MAG: hypothetical protein F4Z77_06320 [Dehalococcoidia bacterium]|nr:hypothetical protein [Dehalococcoidia bacterium]MYA52511.1 hypothetical protein [Dehalococcoidia bacterium]
MRSITFSQALLAVGLIGLTLPLTVGQNGIFHVSAAYAFEGGPSPVGLILALAATLAVAIAILVVGLMRTRAAAGEAPLTYPQLLVTIGLFGLLVAGSLSPTSLAFSIVTGWDESSWWTSAHAGPLALQLGALAIPLLVIASNLKGALRRSPSVEGEAATKPLTCLAVLTLVATFAAAPVEVMRPFPQIFFSGRYSFEDIDGPIVGLEVGMAPELISFALVAIAIPVAVLVLLRGKEEGLARTAYAGPLLIAAALVVGSAGILGVTLLLLFGVPIAALLWPLGRGPRGASPPGGLTTGQVLAWVALICLASTTAQAYVVAVAFTYPASSYFEPLPGPATALALAYAVSLTVLVVAMARLRTKPEADTA